MILLAYFSSKNQYSFVSCSKITFIEKMVCTNSMKNHLIVRATATIVKMKMLFSEMLRFTLLSYAKYGPEVKHGETTVPRPHVSLCRHQSAPPMRQFFRTYLIPKFLDFFGIGTPVSKQKLAFKGANHTPKLIHRHYCTV